MPAQRPPSPFRRRRAAADLVDGAGLNARATRAICIEKAGAKLTARAISMAAARAWRP